MEKRLYIILIALLATSSLSAQYMKHAVGLRSGLSQGISFQYFYQEDKDIKFLMSSRDNGVQLTAMVQRYEPVMSRFGESFYVFYGLGLHAGITHKEASDWSFPKHGYGLHYDARGIVGADAVMGLEFRANTIPVSFGLEYKPFFDLFGHRLLRLGLFDFGFTFKYHF
jgi:hypothetical protein